MKAETKNHPRWLLFFYSVPAKPTANRMKVWRRLLKAGALPLKGSVYALPYNDEHHELLSWLVSEVSSMKGEAAFVKAAAIETMTDAEVVALFDSQRAEAYRALGKRLEDVGRKVSAVRVASGTVNGKAISAALDKCVREYDEIRGTDFFSSKAGIETGRRINALSAELSGLSGGVAGKSPGVVARKAEDYRGRTWVTRKKPFVDRMASAWLVRRFVDRDAAFGFIDEAEVAGLPAGEVSYDVRGGEFTHAGDLCTFEVLMKSFGLKDKALKSVAEVVHELDVKDGRYNAPEARGIEEILSGIRKMARDDKEALEKGMAIFEMLYASKK
ncbi:MAG: chromate resistance protein [Nitrospirae bacterium]|nr:chromate resistance protein [Nitrospirota bacterium]